MAGAALASHSAAAPLRAIAATTLARDSLATAARAAAAPHRPRPAAVAARTPNS